MRWLDAIWNKFRRRHHRLRDIALSERNKLSRQLVEKNAELAMLRYQLSQGRISASSDPKAQGGTRSIIFSSLPKSGTEFLWGGLRDASGLSLASVLRDADLMEWYLSGYCNEERIASTGLFVSERLAPKPLRASLDEGCLWGSHAPASHHNLCALSDAGVDRITVLIRDPRDCVVSWTHHLRAIGQSFRNFNTLAMHLPLDYYEWDHQRRLSYQVRTFLPAAVNWTESWLDAPAHEPDLSVQFVTFTELAREPLAMFERVLSFHQIENYDLSRIAPAQPGARHFRSGRSGEWETEFSESDKQFAKILMDGRLERMIDLVPA